MKNLKILFVLSFILIYSVVFAGKLIVDVKPYKEISGSEFGLCISNYKVGFNSGADQFTDIYYSDNGHFELELDKGRYAIGVLHPSSEPFFYHFYISKDNPLVELKVDLDAVAVPTEIKRVQIVGDFCNFDWTRAVDMDFNKNKKIWQLPDNKILDSITEYHFIINDKILTHLPFQPVKKVSTWANYSNIYSSGTIEFNPKKFKKEPILHKHTVKGAEDNYNEVCIVLSDLFIPLEWHIYRVADTAGLSKYKESYTIQWKIFNELMKKQDGKYPWLFTEGGCKMIDYHPIEAEINFASQNNQREKANNLRQSNEYIENLKQKIKFLKSVDKNELSISSYIIREMFYINHDLESYDLNEELNIPYGYFKQFVFDILKVSDNDEICGEILLLKAGQLKYSLPEKANTIYKDIKTKYPRYSNVKNGRIDKMLKEFDIKEGVIAPDFEIETTTGTKIKLADLKGKFVFLDFWGTWCAPCREEIANIKKMTLEIPTDQLVVIGLSCRDKSDVLAKFLIEKEINYPNAVTANSIMENYGINKFPTTFLIDRNGVIRKKDLRGSNLTEMVKEAMKD